VSANAMFGTSHHLNRIASLVTVGDVSHPVLGSFDANEAITTVFSWWPDICLDTFSSDPMDHLALVSKDGRNVGSVGFDSLVNRDKGVLADVMHPLAVESLVSFETPLIQAAKLFHASSPYVYLVLQSNEITGWMSYHDLLSIPFRACLCSMLLAIEQAMLEIALTDPTLAASKLSPNRVKSLEQQIKRPSPKLKHASTRQLLDRSLFSDKLCIIRRCKTTSDSIPAVNDRLVDAAKDVRNSLAHPSEDFRLLKLLSKERLHDFLTRLTELETQLRNYLDLQRKLED